MDQREQEVDPAGQAGVARHRRWLKGGAGYIIAAACLVWVFHDVRYGELLHGAVVMNWTWVALAVLFDIVTYCVQGLRWRLLLAPLGDLSVVRATRAIYAGLFINEIAPMRAGEVVRVFLVSRWLSRKVSEVVSSILVERFFDAVWLALAAGLVILLVPLPPYLVDAEEILAAIVFAATALFAYVVLRPAGGARRLPGMLQRLAAGLRDIGRSRRFYESFAASSAILVFQILSFWMMLLAYRLHLSLWQGAAALLILRLGTAIPSTPSNVGTYQFFTVVGLTLFGVDKTTATGFSVIAFLILTIPLWLIGLFAFARSGISLQNARKEIASLRSP